jgi:hypothetical protein
MESLGVLNVELVPIHNRLVALRKQLIALASQPKVPKAELKPIVEELRKIDSWVTPRCTLLTLAGSALMASSSALVARPCPKDRHSLAA